MEKRYFSERYGVWMREDVLQLFPLDRRAFWQYTAKRQEDIQEIRLRTGRPVIVLYRGKERFLDYTGSFTEKAKEAYCAGEKELEAVLNHICHYSPYAFEDEIRQGFVTVAGGHRVGLAGQVVLEGQSGVRTIKHISYMNIRIAHQIKGAADRVLPFIYERGRLKNTLIISPPGCGKTTLLRDLIRQISDGNAYGKGVSVGVVDERSEIAGSYLGCPQNDVGMRTDVLDACPKALGMMLLLRSMSPAVIAIDEIGGGEDMRALRQASSCGSSILATIHGEGIEDYLQKSEAKDVGAEQLFDCFLILGKREGKPVLRKIYERDEAYAAYSGRNHDGERMFGNGTLVSRADDRKAAGAAGAAEDSGDACQ